MVTNMTTYISIQPDTVNINHPVTILGKLSDEDYLKTIYDILEQGDPLRLTLDYMESKNHAILNMITIDQYPYNFVIRLGFFSGEGNGANIAVVDETFYSYYSSPYGSFHSRSIFNREILKELFIKIEDAFGTPIWPEWWEFISG